VLGLPAESDWVLYAPNYFDRVLIHNPIGYELSNLAGRYASRTRLVEVFFVNGTGPVTANFAASGSAMGSYNGVYVLEEKVKRNKNRVDVEALQPENTNAPAITGGYMLKIDRSDQDERTITAGNQNMIWVYPDGPQMDTPQRLPQKNYLSNYFASFYIALTGPNWTNPVTGYTPWIDVDSWIDHNIQGVLTMNADWLRLSGYFFKNRSKGIEMGPVWDYDRSQGTGDNGNSDFRAFSPRSWRAAAPLGGNDYGTDFFNNDPATFPNPWYRILFTDPNFWQMWIDRYQQLRQTVLTSNNVISVIDGFASQVRLAQPREAARWTGSGPSDASPRNGTVAYNGVS